MINLLRQNGPDAKLKKAEIFDAAKEALNRDVTSNEYSKVSYLHFLYGFHYHITCKILFTYFHMFCCRKCPWPILTIRKLMLYIAID